MTSHEAADLAQRIAQTAQALEITIAAAESLTSGLVLSELGRGEGASQWLRGGVVAYASEVKRQLLGVSDGPVVTARCAEEMAAGVARLLGADVTIATTGVGGPGPDESQPEGTVYVGWWCRGQRGSELHHFDGEPADVVEKTVTTALDILRRRIESLL